MSAVENAGGNAPSRLIAIKSSTASKSHQRVASCRFVIEAGGCCGGGGPPPPAGPSLLPIFRSRASSFQKRMSADGPSACATPK